MEMFGGLTKTSSRIAIAAALGMVFGGFALSSPAKAQNLGGDCCADLEERVAELEATTVRKGNKKVSVTLSGWVVKSINWWNDGVVSGFAVGDKDYDLGSRFAITGSATIAPGWSAGYNITVLAPSTVFGFGANQFNEFGGTYGAISTLYSYGYIKSDTWGALNWGHLSPASDNPAVLADASGTVIESNGVFFEGPGFLLRAKQSGASGGLTTGTVAGSTQTLTWGSVLSCDTLGAGIGADCFGAAQPAVRYDSPTWGGFRFETSYGTNELVPAVAGTRHSNFADIAVFYNDDWWTNWKVSAAYAFTWLETSGLATGTSAVSLNQVGATIMNSPSGLGIYGMYNQENSNGLPDTDSWYVKPFYQSHWWDGVGKTIWYGEYGQYTDMFGGTGDVCLAFSGLATNVTASCGAAVLTGAGALDGFTNSVVITGSQVDRYGLGVVQEIDAAAMHLFARWQHQEADIGFRNVDTGDSVKQSFESLNIYQLGGIWFF
jgi:hypothetical protein